MSRTEATGTGSDAAGGTAGRDGGGRTVILVHGYGVRGSFWEKLAPRLECSGLSVLTPDLAGDSPEDLAGQIEMLARTAAADAPVMLVGHSLGGILCSLVASRVDAGVVSHVAVIAAPFGGRTRKLNPFVRFLIRFRLLPQFLARPRFFSAATPKVDQKRWFARAVPESPHLQRVLFAEGWFPAEAFSAPLSQRTLVIYSEADRIVAPAATAELARALQTETLVFARERGVGHNDFAASDGVADEVARSLLRFFEAQGPEAGQRAAGSGA